MSSSPLLGLTYLAESQASAHLLANEAFNRLEQAASLEILDRDLTEPPGSPSDGDAYLVAASPMGAWAGQAGKVAVFYAGWIFLTARGGMTAFVHDEKLWIGYSSQESEWHPLQDVWLPSEHWTGKYSTEGDKIFSKVIDFGALPNATEKTVAHSISNLDLNNHLAHQAWTRNNSSGQNSPAPVLLVNGAVALDVRIDGTHFFARASHDLSGFTMKVRLEYCKT